MIKVSKKIAGVILTLTIAFAAIIPVGAATSYVSYTYKNISVTVSGTSRRANTIGGGAFDEKGNPCYGKLVAGIRINASSSYEKGYYNFSGSTTKKATSPAIPTSYANWKNMHDCVAQ